MWLTKPNIFTIWPFTQKTLLIFALEYRETVHIGGFSYLMFLKNSYFLTFLRLCGRLNMVIIFFTFFPLVCVSACWLWVGSVTPIRHWGHVLSQCWDQGLEKLAGSSFCFLGHPFWEPEIPRKETSVCMKWSHLGPPDWLICYLPTSKDPWSASHGTEDLASQVLPKFKTH